MKKIRFLVLAVLTVALTFAFASCGSTDWVTLTTDNAENYFDIDYGVDIVEKTEDDTFITEGQFFVSAAEKTSYNLDDVQLTVQVIYKVETSSDKSVTKTKQLALDIGDMTGNDMEMFFEKYSDAEEYPEIEIESVKISAVTGRVKS